MALPARTVGDTLKALPSIAGSPFAILAYIAVIGVWLLSYLRTACFRLLIGQISTLPEADRRKVLEAEMNTVIPPSITAEEWLRSRRQLYVTISLRAVVSRFFRTFVQATASVCMTCG
jgi:hypothetical protein